MNWIQNFFHDFFFFFNLAKLQFCSDSLSKWPLSCTKCFVCLRFSRKFCLIFSFLWSSAIKTFWMIIILFIATVWQSCCDIYSTALFSREVWPNDVFGSADIEPEDEFMCLHDIFKMTDLPQGKVFYFVCDLWKVFYVLWVWLEVLKGTIAFIKGARSQARQHKALICVTNFGIFHHFVESNSKFSTCTWNLYFIMNKIFQFSTL